MSSISKASDNGFTARRASMVDSQIRTNKVTSETVIDAIESVAREDFVPQGLRSVAYVDDDIVLEEGRCVIEPRVLARMLQAVKPDATSHALVVGVSTGYAAAVLSKLARTVVAEESVASHAETATAVLEEQGITNVVIEQGPLLQAAAEHGPFDIVLFAGSIAQAPANLVDFLEQGGRAIAVVADSREGFGNTVIWTRVGDHLGQQSIFDASIPALPEFDPPRSFSF